MFHGYRVTLHRNLILLERRSPTVAMVSECAGTIRNRWKESTFEFAFSELDLSLFVYYLPFIGFSSHVSRLNLTPNQNVIDPRFAQLG